MISYKVKGIILAVIISLASIMMPFSVYADMQTSIAPTFSSITTQWNGHLSITNFSEGTNTQASSILEFTFDDDYYGMVYFDGYGPNNQHIANFATVYIAGGYGSYRYLYYQNGVINITNVTISIVNVVKPQSTVDLTQIITLLTAIENDTSAIDNVLDTTLAQIRLVLAELIESNGYLETLTKLRQWNIPIESYGFNLYLIQNHFEIQSFENVNSFNYPYFYIPANSRFLGFTVSPNDFSVVIYIDKSINNKQSLEQYISITGNNFTYDFTQLSLFQNVGRCIKLDFHSSNGGFNVIYLTALTDIHIMGIFEGIPTKYFSTDFALLYGFNNKLLDDINLIANGTTSSNSASSDLDDASSDYSSIADDVVGVETGLTTNFDTEVNKIDLNTGLNVFGGYFLTSATWVRTQFDRLTENTPYGSMIVYGLTLGFALLMLGKVFL